MEYFLVEDVVHGFLNLFHVGTRLLFDVAIQFC